MEFKARPSIRKQSKRGLDLRTFIVDYLETLRAEHTLNLTPNITPIIKDCETKANRTVETFKTAFRHAKRSIDREQIPKDLLFVASARLRSIVFDHLVTTKLSSTMAQLRHWEAKHGKYEGGSVSAMSSGVTKPTTVKVPKLVRFSDAFVDNYLETIRDAQTQKYSADIIPIIDECEHKARETLDAFHSDFRRAKLSLNKTQNPDDLARGVSAVVESMAFEKFLFQKLSSTMQKLEVCESKTVKKKESQLTDIAAGLQQMQVKSERRPESDSMDML